MTAPTCRQPAGSRTSRIADIQLSARIEWRFAENSDTLADRIHAAKAAGLNHTEFHLWREQLLNEDLDGLPAADPTFRLLSCRQVGRGARGRTSSCSALLCPAPPIWLRPQSPSPARSSRSTTGIEHPCVDLAKTALTLDIIEIVATRSAHIFGACCR